MKRLKRIMALVIAMAMVLGMGAMTAFADGAATSTADGTYTITIKNSTVDTQASINGHTFSAYKLFDLAYVDDANDQNDTTPYAQDQGPHAYYLSTTSPFYTTAADKAAIEKYFTLTELSGDSSKVLVTPKMKDTADKNPWETGYDGEHLSENSCFTATEAYELAQALKTTMETLTPNGTSPAASGEQAVIDVSTSGAGYYLVTGDGQGLDENGTAAETVTAAIALTSTDPKAEIIAKLSAPKVEKEIDEGDGVKYDEHAIGETVPYIVTTTVPNMTGYESYFFVLSDTLSTGLTLNDDDDISTNTPYDEGFSVTFKKEGETDVALTRVADHAAAVAADDTNSKTFYVKKNGQNFEIVLHDFIQYKGTLVTEANVDALTGDGSEGSGNRAKIGTYVGYEGWTIEVKYSATINQDAAIGDTGNVNTAKLIFSNNPDLAAEGSPDDGKDYPSTYDKEDITGESPESKTVTYVTGVKFNKVDKDKKPLKDAKFTFVGTNLKNVVEEEAKYFRPKNNQDQASDVTYYLLKDGTYTTTAPTKDTVDQENASYTEGTWRLYVQTDWDYDPNNQLTSYTLGTGASAKTVQLFTTGTDPWKPAYVQDTMQTWNQGVFVEDSSANPAYYPKTNGEYTTTAPTAATAGDYIGGTSAKTYKLIADPDWETMTVAEKAAATVSYTVETDTEGIITFTGLRVGEYTLTEIEAPDGYNMLKEPVKIKVEWTAPTVNTNTTLVSDADACTWKVSYKLKDSDQWKEITSTDDANLFPLDIENQSGVELPSTGGIGTTIFYVVGAILVIGAGVILITRRRMDA
jgi:fimbrial isopeptide formation D2 family protein/LPXTG-motif cell wall-anchored protein